MAATTEEDDVDNDKEDVCRTTAAVAALPQPLEEILEAKKRPAGCATILGDVMMFGLAWLGLAVKCMI